MIFYLNGTSSAGKTSIALKLQSLMSESCFYFSIDTLLHALAEDDLQAIMGKIPYPRELQWEKIFEGYFSSVAALAKVGNNVIADCPVYSEKLGTYFEKYLGSIHEKIIVKLECPLAVLEERERARGDRAIGIAKGQHPGIHQFLKYDFEINTNASKVDEMAMAILSAATKLAQSSKF